LEATLAFARGKYWELPVFNPQEVKDAYE